MSRIDELTSLAQAYAADTIALADALWADPELRWAEHGAVRRQLAYARDHALRTEHPLADLETAFVAEGGTGGPVIALLGEYDALDGLSQQAGAAIPLPIKAGAPGHGCGHNLLGSGALLATVIATEYLRRAGIAGRVRYIGCPAEEASCGKTVLVQRGVFDDVDLAATWHPADHLSARQYLTLAYAQLDIRFEGVASHASVSPERGRSALDALELCNVGVNFLREHVPDDVRMHYAITDAGGHSPNVVPAHAQGRFVVRGRRVADVIEVRERLERVAQGAALMTDTTVTVAVVGVSSEFVPNAPLEHALDSVLQELGSVTFTAQEQREASAFAEPAAAAPLDGMPRPLLGTTPVQTAASTDVGDVSWVVPTVMLTTPTMAVGTPMHSWQLVAQGTSDAAHRGTRHAAVALAEFAIRAIEDEDLRSRALLGLRDAAGARGYVSPLPQSFEPRP